jgi:hypothetical protein
MNIVTDRGARDRQEPEQLREIKPAMYCWASTMSSSDRFFSVVKLVIVMCIRDLDMNHNNIL